MEELQLKNTNRLLRNEIGAYMTNLGERDPRVIVVNADLSGTCRNRNFTEKFPSRAFNVGIAEQNAVSFAAGLAHEGFLPYVFSMAPFLSMRACEQCRTDVAYGNLPVKLIGTYAGLSGGISGATHWGIEDCGIMTSIPGITVLEPCDSNQAKRMLDLSIEYSKPLYIRSSIEPVKDIYRPSVPVKIGGSNEIIYGDDGCILCCGITVKYAIESSQEILKKYGYRIRVVDMYSIKPIDKEAVISAAKTGNVLVAHDHNTIGGLGTMVASIIAEACIATKYKVLGLADKFTAMAHANYLYHLFEMDTAGITKNMLDLISSNKISMKL